MDSQRFDSLVKSLAAGTSRRSVLKGVLGLGGAAIAGGTLLERGAEAARRPTPTPKPITCPGSQHWNGSACVCTTGETCGSACCLIGSECCDGACCFGHCYGEELCCSYDNWCEAAGECCPDGATCCGEQGCVVIEEGDCGCDGSCPEGFECCGGQCCSTGYCAAGICCAFGVCGDSCRDDPLQVCCNGVLYDPETQYCCDGTVVEGECCASGGCPEGFECCNGGCCAEGLCSNDGCCAFLACGGVCSQGPEFGCCNGDLYELDFAICCNNTIAPKAGKVCCDNALYDGNCCVDADCGTCSSCVKHHCGPLRC